MLDSKSYLIVEYIKTFLYFTDTVSLQEIADDPLNDEIKDRCSIEINNLQERIDIMHKRLTDSDQCDDCLIQ
jgi:hypothetical protein